jgi:ubiquinone/menaquinone biosynthesis C-methylase UbiE
MNVEQQVAEYYTRSELEEKILSSLRRAGKDVEQLRTDDLAPLDEFHIGGRESTEALAAFMELRPGMHLLDLGCGIGGPARYFAERGCRVTGIDLTEEFLRVAENLTRRLKLDHSITFRQASALELPFESGTFDGAYQIHVGMNLADKAGVFREVARVLKPGSRFAIFDLMRSGEGPLDFPVPWARSHETSFVESLEVYRKALESAGLRVVHERSRREFGLEFMQRMMAQVQAAAGPPALGVHLLMGEQAPLMLKNSNVAIVNGVLAPVELVAIAN